MADGLPPHDGPWPDSRLLPAAAFFQFASWKGEYVIPQFPNAHRRKSSAGPPQSLRRSFRAISNARLGLLPGAIGLQCVRNNHRLRQCVGAADRQIAFEIQLMISFYRRIFRNFPLQLMTRADGPRATASVTSPNSLASPTMLRSGRDHANN
jgi:hypothetical protein